MHDTDLQVLRALHAWRVADKPALLATMMRSEGRDAKQPISLLAMSASGDTVGSGLNGIQDELLKHVRGSDLLSRSSPPQLLRHEIDSEQAQSFGWPCGGILEVLLEFSPSVASLGEMLGLIDAGLRVRRNISLADGTVTLSLEDYLPVLEQPLRISVGFGPAFRLLLLGGGALSADVAHLALMCGFKVAVCDERPHHTPAGGVDWMRNAPDEAVRRFRPDCNSAVVAIALDTPRIDAALLEALHTDAMYIGSIGSHRSAESLRARLEASARLAPQVLDRLRGPIGLYFDSLSPAEIALSVVTELVATKNGVASSFGGTSIGPETRSRHVGGVLTDAPDF
ncbi:xanthine dehydrogenase accessory factor [Variovorax boronicumulans]|uniref:XdhC family protein n=1 Tax=Variovorax boronicumulans TaxID=436515 RepID=UPI0027835B8D|nr:XdhC/CoxI family protein [Variovorax boronicumulans]MDQ0038969.1 xanthine dehydrogenase accessory factor [Variovorax boronicumulans]MDQ0044747.1 xanthine dehydrogenase accessory factor [Variovorax boronicumulans]